jgi:hypothetical protein
MGVEQIIAEQIFDRELSNQGDAKNLVAEPPLIDATSLKITKQ